LNDIGFNTLERGATSEYQIFENVHLTDDYYQVNYPAGIGEISIKIDHSLGNVIFLGVNKIKT
jgi:hypothetical protein